jgi:hypothetical protein
LLSQNINGLSTNDIYLSGSHEDFSLKQSKIIKNSRNKNKSLLNIRSPPREFEAEFKKFETIVEPIKSFTIHTSTEKPR